VSAPKMEIKFTKTMLAPAEKLYKNLTFYLNLYAPSIPEQLPGSAYPDTPVFTLQTRVMDSAGAPVSQPTPPPTLGRGGISQSTNPVPPPLLGNYWVYVARGFAIISIVCLLCCLRSVIAWLWKKPENRRAEEISELIEQSKRNIEREHAALRDQATQDEPMHAVELQEVQRHANGI